MQKKTFSFVFQVHKSILPSHTVYSTAMEMISNSMWHPSQTELEELHKKWQEFRTRVFEVIYVINFFVMKRWGRTRISYVLKSCFPLKMQTTHFRLITTMYCLKKHAMVLPVDNTVYPYAVESPRQTCAYCVFQNWHLCIGSYFYESKMCASLLCSVTIFYRVLQDKSCKGKFELLIWNNWNVALM